MVTWRYQRLDKYRMVPPFLSIMTLGIFVTISLCIAFYFAKRGMHAKCQHLVSVLHTGLEQCVLKKSAENLEISGNLHTFAT